jgi:hypothetical protein
VKPNFSGAYVEWLPFVDRVWINHLLEGLRMVPNSPIEIDRPETNRPILPAQISSSAYFAAALRFARRPRAAR